MHQLPLPVANVQNGKGTMLVRCNGPLDALAGRVLRVQDEGLDGMLEI